MSQKYVKSFEPVQMVYSALTFGPKAKEKPTSEQSEPGLGLRFRHKYRHL
jgi:hypothetical protein